MKRASFINPKQSSELAAPVEPESEFRTQAVGGEEKGNTAKSESFGEKKSDGISTEPSTSKGESSSEPASSLPIQTDVVIKPKKQKRRHFKGATYGLYLTPSSKKKRLKKPVIDTNVKDDEMSLPSTENGSYVDSSDAGSMFSDDFNTSSERSLADDEANSNQQIFPVQLSDTKAGSSGSQNQTSSTESPPAEKSVTQDPAPCDSPANSEQNVPEPPAEPELVSTQELVTQEEINPVDEQSTVTVTEEPQAESMEVSTTDVEVSTNDVEVDANVIEVSTNEPVPPVRLNAMKSVSSCPAPVSEKALVPVAEASHDPKEDEHYEFSGLNNVDNNSDDADNDPSKSAPASTIATSVKSRQRMKRRFTDDIVDTDFGILSINSVVATCRKTKIDHAPPQTDDIIRNFEIDFNTEARGGPLTKVENVYSSKQSPIDKCACEGNTYEVNTGDTPKNYFCQAVDSYEEKLVGCCNPVTTFRLVRPSVRIPFTVMCDMHLWRMKCHHCCPRCGVFCSQGTVVRCIAEKHNFSIHLYHERCQGSNTLDAKYNFCLHCGDSSHTKIIRLECEMMSPPAFFQSQFTLNLMSKARIKCGAHVKPKKQSDSSSKYKIHDDRILTYDGLPEAEMQTLKSLLSTLEKQNIDELPDYPVEDLYSASLNGDVTKVLHMLAKGVDPNEKFEEHDFSISLHAAATSGHLLIAHILIEAGAVCDAMNQKLRTPLIVATENNHEGVVESLVKHEAPINTKGEVGMTCLHLAARDGRLRLCKLFVDSGRARINALDDGGWTPIVWASEHGHLDVVDYLINRGGDPNIRDNEGNIALHWAAFCGTVEVCTLLLDHNCCVDEANEHGDTPLHIAARQDNFRCVDLFLSSSANFELRNKAGELPLDCCSHNRESRSYEAITSCMLLRKMTKFPLMFEKVISPDIARGREQYPIRCLNGVDDVQLEENEFLYVTENCETCPLKIDRCITSLQHCSCKDQCTLSSCTCSAISFKCWYDKDGHLLPEFNMLDPPLLFECNRACSCDVGICQNRVVQRGLTCRLELVRTVGRGWGVRTLNDIPKGTFVCEYVGELITDSEADTREDDSYLFDLDNKDGETYCLDARYFGNISRFINHFCEPNLVPVKVFIDHQDLSFPRIAFFSLRHIFQYEELGFDYGEKFWVIKSKSFTCNCESPSCKYSADTIKETLECYDERTQESVPKDATIYPV